MRGAELEALVRRLMNGDSAARDLAWDLLRADDVAVLDLIERHAALVAQYQPEPVADDHPNLFPTS
jgi:hypothetical protein